MDPSVRALIDDLDLAPLLDEGGWYRRTWTSPVLLGGGRPAGTAIVALFTAAGFSALHRLGTDEVWHFYRGDPLRMLLLHPDGSSQDVRLGDDAVQWAVPAGSWMGAHPIGGWSLVGTTMAPGFDPSEFELGSRAGLCAGYPAVTDAIVRLTRLPDPGG